MTATATQMQTQTENAEELAGDSTINEHDGCRYCLGCILCEPNLEDEF